MIEPQNTVYPVAAEPRPAQQPQGEEAGFGAMLAQSLGLTSQLDPGAVQQITSGHHQQGEAADDSPADDTDQRSGDAVRSVPDAKTTPLPLGASLASPRLETVGRFRPTDAVPVTEGSSTPVPATTGSGNDPVLGASVVQVPGGEAELPDPDNEVSQTLLTDDAASVPPALDSGGSEGDILVALDRGDSIGLPPVGDFGDDSIAPPVVQRHIADPAPGPVAPGNGIDPATQPLPESTPAIPVAPANQPVPAQHPQNPQPELAETPRPAIPAQVDVKPVPNRFTSKVSAAAEAADPIAAAEAAKGVPVATPAPSAEPRVDLVPEARVLLDRPSRGVRVAAADVSTETAPTVVADGGPANAPVSFSAPATNPAPIAAPASITEPLAAQTSALAERVMQAVDLQRTQPPPRSMVVEIPEIEGLRLVVSVRTGGQVSVTQAGGASAEGFTPFAEDLSRVLSQRGFVMNGDDRRDGRNPHAEEERTPFRAPRPNFRRPVRTDNDLRI